jgi:DNA-binding GntR family transcriptional regulator
MQKEQAQQDKTSNSSLLSSIDGAKGGAQDGVSRGWQAVAVYNQLREEILTGLLDPSQPISQVQLAGRLGVSRTPLREALRMLERDGLIHSEPNRMVRVTPLSIDDLEELYALRIVVEPWALRLTAPRLAAAELDELDGCLTAMDAATSGHDFARWQDPHRRFHELLVAHAGRRVAGLASEIGAQSDRYRRAYLEDTVAAWNAAAQEHREIAAACRESDEVLAADRLARHLARTALTIIAAAAPAHDSVKIRTALLLIGSSTSQQFSVLPSRPAT